MLGSLYIKNFRSLEDLHVPKLGRVNLIVGRNNSGKSSVLEALRIYAGNAQRELLEKIADEHDESSSLQRAPEDLLESDMSYPFEAFFSGRSYPTNDRSAIVIGESSSDEQALTISHGFLVAREESFKDEAGNTQTALVRMPISRHELMSEPEENVSQALFIRKAGKEYRLRFDTPNSRIRTTVSQIQPSIPCSLVSTRFVSSEELALAWDRIVLTDYEEVIQAAVKIVENDFEGLAFVKVDSSRASYALRRSVSRSAKVKIKSSTKPVPLNSMGDGMLRVLQLVLNVIPAKGGFLLIDEFEGGLHYAVQEKIWNLLFDLAVRFNIQIFATTHSWDCIESFAKISKMNSGVSTALFRLGRSVRSSDHGRVIATVFDREQLFNVTQAEVEVR